MLSFELHHQLGGLELDVALTAESGEPLALAGPSGAGKTSVLRALAGLLTPTAGWIECAGERWLDTAAGVDVPAEERRVGYVFQEYALFPHMRAWENVAYPLGHLPRSERRRRALELLERLGVTARADARPQRLSGGERQRVALARALAREPRALLLDEPLAALDVTTAAGAARELRRAIDDAGVPAIIVTHDFTEAAQLAPRIAVLEHGRVVQVGSAVELAAAPAAGFVADFAGASVLTGVATAAADGLTHVALDGGGVVLSTAPAVGAAAVCVFPWDVALEPAGAEHRASSRNLLSAEVVSIATLGNRVRVGLATPQPLTAEVTEAAARELGLERGRLVTASWKASATRVLPR